MPRPPESQGNPPEKLWGGRFSPEGGRLAEAFTASIGFDRRLWRQDIRGSLAHARMLGAAGVLAREEVETIVEGLGRVAGELEAGTFPYRVEAEDIHSNIELRLTELIGPVAGKLHTARSRNDQVALDVHLFLRDEIPGVVRRLRDLQTVLVERAETDFGRVMPGYTHLQPAQPVLVSHHWLAYFWMLERDRGRLIRAWQEADRLPLGAGALAGVPYPINPDQVGRELGFSRRYANSLDAVSDRDYVLDFLFACTVLMVHCSRLTEEIVLWTSQEFGFLELDDAWATGSSIMPHKKNPDPAELVRGKTGRVTGNLMALLMTVKALPLAYHTDLQEDKERLFDTLDTINACLQVLAGLLATARLRPEGLERALAGSVITATELADYLAERGVPFREAHRLAGQVVRHCLERGISLQELAPQTLAGFSPDFGPEVLARLDPAASVARRTSPGGTAPRRVAEQIALCREILVLDPLTPSEAAAKI